MKREAGTTLQIYRAYSARVTECSVDSHVIDHRQEKPTTRDKRCVAVICDLHRHGEINFAQDFEPGSFESASASRVLFNDNALFGLFFEPRLGLNLSVNGDDLTARIELEVYDGSRGVEKGKKHGHIDISVVIIHVPLRYKVFGRCGSNRRNRLQSE